ncbi:hypothetical protein ANN_22417 [Periplaneta americana]|uniref:Uncharacterized protein n=1 Tax=Periplaneta americana TaxID=6978 RepID=A0ABQ8S924_PERAM|nr:hypothetical protein ANN_22417 [Periplaneta americana]
MAGLCEGGNEPPGSLKAIYSAVGVNAGSSSTSIQRTLTFPQEEQDSKAEEAVTENIVDFTPAHSLSNVEDAASPTVDKTETVDQSPGPANEEGTWDATGLPRSLPLLQTESMTTLSSFPVQSTRQSARNTYDPLPSAGDAKELLSSTIEDTRVLFHIDGLADINSTFDQHVRITSTTTSGINETISLGPVELSSVLHQSSSTSVIQTDEDKASHVNKSDIETNDSNKDQSVTFMSSSIDTPPKHGIQQGNEFGFPSPIPREPDAYSVYHGPLESSNPYAHWDSDSEEQEHEMELQRIQELSQEELEQDEAMRTSSDELTDDDLEISSPSTSTSTSGRSYLLLLAGNSTIVRLRQKDFAKYLKLNLAARLSLEYDDVRVNRVVLAPPQLLVNVSVVTPSEATDPENALEEEASFDDAVLKEEEPLHLLAETNATLLELSGEEYHVVRLLSLRSHPPDKKLDVDDDLPSTSTIISDRHNDVELVIYTAVGGACALVILATLFITFGRYLRIADIQWPWRRPKSMYSSWTLPSTHLRHRRMGDEYPATTATPPTVIYSGSFAARAAAASSSANSWVDEYQAQSSVILTDDAASAGGGAMLGIGAMKLSTANPLYTDLEMGGAAGNVIMGHNAALYAETPSVQRHQSPSKLHIFSCRPGSIVIPAAVPAPQHHVRRNIPDSVQPQTKAAADTRPLDVRVKEDLRLGHDNPNYQM